MSPQDLGAFIFDGRASAIQRSCLSWMDQSPTFRTFVAKYRDKIRAKVRGCRGEDDLHDLLWELEIGHLLLKNPDFQVEYEPYGTGGSRSPDYLIATGTGDSFSLEAARIREGRSETRCRILENEIRETIRAVPSQVGVTLNIGSLLHEPGLLDNIESHLDSIKAAIPERIALAHSELQVGESRVYAIPGAEGLVELQISKPAGKARRTNTSYHGGSSPVWYTQREFTKFGDIVCEKLGQFRAGTPGVLAIASRNSTHEDIDCEHALSELSRLARKPDEAFFLRKGFEGTADFLFQSRGLSGIIYRSSWIGDGPRNFVWSNPGAGSPVNHEIITYLENMN
jgi:hypothetical protein